MLLLIASLVFNLAHADDSSKMKAFVDDLIGKMTIEEKVGQMTQYTAEMSVTGASIKDNYREEIMKGQVGSIFNGYTPRFTRQLQEIAVEHSRLKIPLLFALDVVHGHRTIFPIPLGESSTWDMKLMEKSARIAATEASADGIHWTFAPMVDVGRDPRWGRISEGAGEDPYLGSRIAEAKVRGFQTDHLGTTDTVMACAKHYLGYGAALGGRDYNSVNLSEREIFETYLPPFAAAVKAGVATLMPAFNDISGVPSTGNEFYLRKVLRDKLKFQGIVVSDYTAIAEIVNHGVVANETQAVDLAAHAGVDIDMQGASYMKYLPALIRANKIPLAMIDGIVRRILEVKYKFGLFKDPYRFSDEKRAQKQIMTKDNLAAAREVARRSIVMLRNEGGKLPLKKTGTIALIGPMAENRWNQLGSWSSAGDSKQSVDLREGVTSAVGGRAKILYAKGANLINPGKLYDSLNRNGGHLEADPRSDEEMISEAISVAKRADVVVVALGEAQNMSGEAASRTHVRLPENQTALLRALREKSSKPLILIMFNGRPLALEQESQLADSILEAWFLGTESGNAVADVLFGDYNPSGRLSVSFPYSEGQIPIYYGEKPTGRPFNSEDKYTTKYLDAPNEALYPFGFGLSYTQFFYSSLKLSSTRMKPSDKMKVSITVSNNGPVDGEETVQLYVRKMVASISQPVKQLRGFTKVFLQHGESREVSFELSIEDLKFYNRDMKWVAESGPIKVMVGGNSRDILETTFQLVSK